MTTESTYHVPTSKVQKLPLHKKLKLARQRLAEAEELLNTHRLNPSVVSKDYLSAVFERCDVMDYIAGLKLFILNSTPAGEIGGEVAA